jgi:hypothetical protein
MPKKNIIIQFLQMAIGITKFSFLIIIYLDWGILLIRHWQASNKGVMCNYQLQMAGIKYQSKIFPLNPKKLPFVRKRSIPTFLIIDFKCKDSKSV